MHTPTTEPAGGMPRRSSSTAPVAATWVAGTGAFLLVAAAAVFIAVRWDRLPEVTKLALVGALTGGFLAGGRLLRRSLPATGEVVFHLGAFLLPVDLAGLGVRASVGWRALLLSEGVLGVGALGTLGAVCGSVVLTWAATASMIVLAVGVAAVSPLPAALPLAAAAVGAHVAGRRGQAVTWSVAAALGPVLGFAAASVVEGAAAPGAGVLATLGLDGGSLAFLGCVVGSIVLAREARANSDLAMAGLAVGGIVSGLVTTWVGAGVPGRTTTLALPAAFLVVEVAAMLCHRDSFWRPLARGIAAGAEIVAVVVGGLWTVGLVLAAPIVETGLDIMSDVPGWDPQPAAGASLAVLAVAWLLAGSRRAQEEPPVLGSGTRVALGHRSTTAWLALATVAAVEVGTASGVATAAALVAVGAALVWTAVPAAGAIGAGLAFWAPVAVANHPALTMPVGMAAAAVVAAAALADRAEGSWRGRSLALLALLTAASGTALASPAVGQTMALTAFVVQAWALAAVLGSSDAAAGHGARAAMLAAVWLALTAPTGAGVAAAAVATILLAADGVRLHQARVGVAAAATLQALVVLVADVARFDVAETGVVLVLGAVVWGGLAAVVGDEWRPSFLAAAGMGVVGGLFLASADPRLLADALVVSGGLVVAAGVLGRIDAVAHAGGVAITLGVIGHLNGASVTALEPYVAPTAAHLVLAGWRARRSEPLSSWIAYGPAVALLGCAALAERLRGGPAWHALVAGVVGVAAVAVGGWRRLAGPLLLGTAIVVSATLLESLGMLAGVPTWGWLAAGGSLLLAVGVVLERADASPVHAGRRLVDVIGERFE